jgi:1-acyl-sn-glycerol-3-phosphate acyltransferase
MAVALVDRKSKFVMNALGWLCRTLVARRFPKLEVSGVENIPKTGPFLLLANHTSRWDPLVVHTLLNREANYMTHPNELKGLQGLVLPKVGAFPADRRLDIDAFIVRQARAGQPIVIFPEGGVFKDRELHPFKKGTAHVILGCQEAGLDLAVVPVAIEYENDGGKIVVSPPLTVVTNGPVAEIEKNTVVSHITQALHQKMSVVKQALKAELSQAS